MNRASFFFGLVAVCVVIARARAGSEPGSLEAAGISVGNGNATVSVQPYASAERYRVFHTDDLGQPFTEVPAGSFVGYDWVGPVLGGLGFYRFEMEPADLNRVFTATVLNRLAYGPTPDELDRIYFSPDAIGPDAYILEQLAPEQINENLDLPAANASDWQYVTVTGTSTSSTLYLYLDSAGEVHIDDLMLVAGSAAGVGANLIQNGNFETALTDGWSVSTNLTDSSIDSAVEHAGASSLHLVASSAGESRGTAIWQDIVPALSSGQTYTLSYWYLPGTNGRNLTIRISGRGIESTHAILPGAGTPAPLYALLTNGTAAIADLRAWYLLHAVQSQRQLLEVMTQFCDNHLNTLYSKSRDYMTDRVTNDTVAAQTAVNFEFRELSRWRDVWLTRNGTFYDLLKISAESPAQIIYLDTVTNSKDAPNENYARELLELFTFGVDNGYDQSDIEQLARVWTGWRVDKLPPGQENNPLATPVVDKNLDPGTWTFWFRTNRHDTAAKTLFAGKTVDARFGAPYVGRSYELKLPARTGTAGIQDGYDVLRHLADQPYTQEFISVKLCRLFIHEKFYHGVYDYTDAALSPEARLVRDCMRAWETPGPDGRQGNLRLVLQTIFNSAPFLAQSVAQQEVKTPLEFAVSCVRSLRGTLANGRKTADTDGYDLITPLSRLNMPLFGRVEPDGWSEFGRDWISTSALVERMRFAQNFLAAASNPLKDIDYGNGGDDNVSDPVQLLKSRLAQPKWTDAGAVVDSFLGILFPGEGKANLDLDRRAAIEFLEKNDAQQPTSTPFAQLGHNSAAYDGRVRGMVAMLLALPRFHEQ